jgi:hypothetical protein
MQSTSNVSSNITTKKCCSVNTAWSTRKKMSFSLFVYPFQSTFVASLLVTSFIVLKYQFSLAVLLQKAYKVFHKPIFVLKPHPSDIARIPPHPASLSVCFTPIMDVYIVNCMFWFNSDGPREAKGDIYYGSMLV